MLSMAGIPRLEARDSRCLPTRGLGLVSSKPLLGSVPTPSPRAVAPLFPTMAGVLPPTNRDEWLAISGDPLPSDAATAWASTPDCGAVVSFLGVARDHSIDRDGVTSLEYEAYEEQVLRVFNELTNVARSRWVDIKRVAILHRVGILAVGETAVVVVVSSPHRDTAFEAARFCIDTLKVAAPIWKREEWSGGSDWGLNSEAIQSAAIEASEIKSGVEVASEVRPTEHRTQNVAS
jgi:molybdopterin synthase catalytic subunit